MDVNRAYNSALTGHSQVIHSAITGHFQVLLHKDWIIFRRSVFLHISLIWVLSPNMDQQTVGQHHFNFLLVSFLDQITWKQSFLIVVLAITSGKDKNSTFWYTKKSSTSSWMHGERKTEVSSYSFFKTGNIGMVPYITPHIDHSNFPAKIPDKEKRAAEAVLASYGCLKAPSMAVNGQYKTKQQGEPDSKWTKIIRYLPSSPILVPRWLHERNQVSFCIYQKSGTIFSVTKKVCKQTLLWKIKRNYD